MKIGQLKGNKFSLKGNVVKSNDVYDIIDNNDLDNMTISFTSLRVSKHTRGHSHKGIEEIYYFIKGEGIIMLNEEQIEVQRGDTVIIPDGVFHKVFNRGIDNLDFLAIFNDTRKH